jgi:hypothetical protein
MKVVLLCLIVAAISCGAMLAQPPPRTVLIMIPFKAMPLDSAVAERAQSTLATAINAGMLYYAKPAGGDTRPLCQNVDCALTLAGNLGGAAVLYGRIHKVHGDLVLSYALVDVREEMLIDTDDIEIGSPEDVGDAMRGLSERFVDPAEATPLGTGKLRVRGSSLTQVLCVSMGLMVPTHGYGTETIGFPFDVRYSFEFPENSIDAFLGFRMGPWIGVGATHLFSRFTFTPYVGIGIGGHVAQVSGGKDYWGNVLMETVHGVEIRIMAGAWVYQSDIMRMLLSADYSHILGHESYGALTVSLGAGLEFKRLMSATSGGSGNFDTSK